MRSSILDRLAQRFAQANEIWRAIVSNLRYRSLTGELPALHEKWGRNRPHSSVLQRENQRQEPGRYFFTPVVVPVQMNL